MGWVAIYKNGVIEREGDVKTLPDGTIEGVGRPVQSGENGDLVCVAQEDYGHNIAIDLINGVICFEYGTIGVQNGTIELLARQQTQETTDDNGNKVNNVIITQPLFVSICDETNIIGEFMHRIESVPDEKGNYTIDYQPLIWRPIWFSRNTNGDITKVIGAQTTLPEGQGSKNVKKLISLFSNGRLGID